MTALLLIIVISRQKFVTAWIWIIVDIALIVKLVMIVVLHFVSLIIMTKH